MTYLQLSIMMGAYASKDFDICNKATDVYRQQFDWLLAEGMITGTFDNYEITEKGRVWIVEILNTPLPIIKYVIERNK